MSPRVKRPAGFERLTFGEILSAVAGLTLFGLMYGVWYEHPTAASIPAEAIGFETTPNAWQSFQVIDWVLLATIVCTLSAALITVTRSTIHLPLSASAVVTVMGGIAVLLIAYRIIDPIQIQGYSYRRDVALYLGCGAAALVTLGGLLAMREQGTSLGRELARAARG